MKLVICFFDAFKNKFLINQNYNNYNGIVSFFLYMLCCENFLKSSKYTVFTSRVPQHINFWIWIIFGKDKPVFLKVTCHCLYC